ncbi:MAG: iron-containing alcohol dehydrogenase [Candidatus Eremiobacteraeota bacterium]|nr:iron-containing alcohol dehydrogenase [Candidatus Eremiobacteraeota bacterium]
MKFEFATATRIVFGKGVKDELAKLSASFGSRAFVASGMPSAVRDPLLESLSSQQIGWSLFEVKSEPTMAMVREGTEKARAFRCDMVIGIGGGSAMDTAKAIGALLANDGDLLDFLEVIGKGMPLENPPFPVIAVPTTAGTGAEVTCNAVMESPEHRVKVSLRSALMFPRIALVDPLLTVGLPKEVTASSGLDALTQVIEPFVSHKANPMTDAICREGIARAGRSLRRAYECGTDEAAREDMSLVSLFGGMALSNAKLGAVHGFAGPLGGMFHGSHGALCASLLPHVTAANIRALRKRGSGRESLSRFDEIGRLLTGNEKAASREAVEWLETVCAALEVPPLSAFGVKEEDIPLVVEKAKGASSMQGNSVKLEDGELAEILAMALAGKSSVPQGRK